MEGVLEKFSIYDFFNLLFSGGILIAGIHILGFPLLEILYNDIHLPESEILFCAVILLLCYVTGFALQAISSIVGKGIKIQSKMTSTFLLDGNNVIKNTVKLRIYQEKAKELFIRKNIHVKDNNFTPEQCEYFFAYCSYFTQVHGQSKKAEKMRGLKGLSSLWLICFALLSLLGVIRIFYLILFIQSNLNSLILAIISTLIYCALIFISYFRMKIDITYWIRMLLGVYEVCSDIYVYPDNETPK